MFCRGNCQLPLQGFRGGVEPGSTQVRLKLEDGSDYGYTGTVQFSEVMVNESTGTVTLRASFPRLDYERDS